MIKLKENFSKKIWVFVIVLGSILFLVLWQNNKDDDKFTVSISKNKLVVTINSTHIYVQSIGIRDLRNYRTLYTQKINSPNQNFEIKQFSALGLQEKTPYYLYIFQEDSTANYKQIDGTNFCFSGEKILQEKNSDNLDDFAENCQAL